MALKPGKDSLALPARGRTRVRSASSKSVENSFADNPSIRGTLSNTRARGTSVLAATRDQRPDSVEEKLIALVAAAAQNTRGRPKSSVSTSSLSKQQTAIGDTPIPAKDAHKIVTPISQRSSSKTPRAFKRKSTGSGISLKLRFGPLEDGTKVKEEEENAGQNLEFESASSSLCLKPKNPRSSIEDLANGRISARSSLVPSEASGGIPRKSSLREAGSPPRLIGTPVRFTSPEITGERHFDSNKEIVEPTSGPITSVPVPISATPETGLAYIAPQPEDATRVERIITQTQTLIQVPILKESAPFDTAPAAELALVQHIVRSESISIREPTPRKHRKSKKSKDKSIPESTISMSATQTPASSAQHIQRTLSSQPRFQTYDSLQTIPPHLFDLVPSAERLLSRILVPDQGIGAAAILDYENSVPEHKRPLDIKDLDAAANNIMVQIQRAKTAVMGLQGVDRTVEEQEREMKWLEERIEKQREMLGKLKEMMMERKE